MRARAHTFLELVEKRNEEGFKQVGDIKQLQRFVEKKARIVCFLCHAELSWSRFLSARKIQSSNGDEPFADT